jgi:hypothetical protein
MRTAIYTFINTAVQLLGEQMPHKSGGPGKKGRQTHWRKGTMDEFREDIRKRTMEAMEKEFQRAVEDDDVVAGFVNIQNLQAELPAPTNLKRKRRDEGPDHEDDTKMYTSFRFSCITRRLLYDLLLEELSKGKLPYWPFKTVKTSHVINADTGQETIAYKKEIRTPSLSYFLRTLGEVKNISFWKNPTFTKCNLCVKLRSLERQRTIAQSDREAIRKARNMHCFDVMCEVLLL